MTRNNMVSSGIIHWNRKTDNRRMISHDKIFSAFFQLPVFFLFQFCKALFQKTFSYCFCRMKSSGLLLINSKSFSVVSSYMSVFSSDRPEIRPFYVTLTKMRSNLLLLHIIRQNIFRSNTFNRSSERSRIQPEVL